MSKETTLKIFKWVTYKVQTSSKPTKQAKDTAVNMTPRASLAVGYAATWAKT